VSTLLGGMSCPDSKGSLVRAGRARVHHDEPREGRGGLRWSWRQGRRPAPQRAELAGNVQLWEWTTDGAATSFSYWTASGFITIATFWHDSRQ
jgi:hypothetical protein